MSQTVFLSSVSNEFGILRRRLANLGQRTKKCHFRHQDDFFHRGVKTLQKLVEEIEQSSVVLHIIGDQAGWSVPADQANALLDQRPEFEKRFPEVAAQARRGELPATQWEAWLGLLLGKRLLSFQLQSPACEHLQQTHVQRLNALAEHPQVAEDIDALYDEMVGSLITLGIFTEADVRRPVSLPYPTIGTLFKGREEFLEQLQQSLAGSASGRATAITGKAVHGLGGVGKTRLAVEYAWQHVDQYSAVLCVTADSPENMRRNLAELTGPMVLDLPEHGSTEEEVRVAAALHWLHEHPGWFLILDNVDTEPAVVAVEELLARLQGGQVLITSRLGRWSDAVEPLELDVMSADDGARFLLEKTQPKGKGRGRKQSTSDEANALELAGELDGLALALEQAGAYIAQLRKSFAEYLILWRSHQANVQNWLNCTIKYAGPTNSPLRSVAVTWQTTLDELGQHERELLNLLAWFAPDPVPLSVFDSLGQSIDPHTPVSEEANSEPAITVQPRSWNDNVLRETLANLADFSMIRWDAEEESVTVHRVVQDILRTRQAEPRECLERVLRLLDSATPTGDPSDVRTWPAWEPLRAHFAFATIEAEKYDIAEPTSGLMGQLGTLLWAKALHSEAEKLKRRALSIDQRHFGPDSTQSALRMNNLAQTLQATNRLLEAEPLMRRALAIVEQFYGTEDPSVAIYLNNLAILLQATNRLSEAEPLMRRTLAIDEQSYGSDHPEVAIDLHNLASLLRDTNRLSEAEPMMRRALAIDEQSYGAEHPKIALRLSNLALLLKDTNRLSEAEPMMRSSLAIDEQFYGTEHPRVAIRLNNLASLLQATNRLPEAEPLMRRALAIDEQSYGAEHPTVAICLNNLAWLLKETNRLSEAEPLMRRALAVDEHSYGTEHPDVARGLNNLALLLQATNRQSEAEPLMRRALAIFEASLGADHPDTQTVATNLRLLLEKRAKPE